MASPSAHNLYRQRAHPGGNGRSDSELLGAFASDDVAQVDILLLLGADPMTSHTVHGGALLFAVIGNHRDIAEKLLSAGANINGCDPRTGVTPLFMAVRAGNAGLAEYLISRGANPNSRNTRGESILQLADRMKNPATIKLLRDAGAK